MSDWVSSTRARVCMCCLFGDVDVVLFSLLSSLIMVVWLLVWVVSLVCILVMACWMIGLVLCVNGVMVLSILVGVVLVCRVVLV